MKILYFLPGTGVGGIGKYVKDIVSRLDKDIDFTFITLGDPKSELSLYLKTKGKVVNFSGWGIQVFKGVYKELKEQKYDIVHVHLGCWSYLILGLARICGVKKRIAHSHSADNFQSMHGIAKIVYVGSKIFNNYTNNIYFACSDHACKETFGKKILKSKKYYRIFNPVDDRFFEEKHENLVRKEFNIPENSKLVCHIGYMGYHKNHLFILELANELKNEDIYWILVGEGKRRGEFEKYVKDNQLEKIIFTGNRGDIPDILDASDVFILPSLLEGLGTVVLEAQARSTKCIISENVTLEIDMGLNLVKQIALKEQNSWKKAIKETQKSFIPIDEIKKKYLQNYVELGSCSRHLYSIYSS